MHANAILLYSLVSYVLSLVCYVTEHVTELLTKCKPNLDLILVLKMLPVLEEPSMMSIIYIPYL